MKLLEILDRQGIVPALSGRDKRTVLRELAERVAAASGGGVSAGVIEQQLADRERERSTGIGSGVAVPHARAEEVDRLVAVFGRSTEGIDFAALDGKPCHLFFALVSPENKAGVHLSALARICKLLKDDAFRERLMAAATADELYETLRTEDARV